MGGHSASHTVSKLQENAILAKHWATLLASLLTEDTFQWRLRDKSSLISKIIEHLSVADSCVEFASFTIC